VVASTKVSDEETALEPVAVCVVETESSAVVERASVDSRLLDIEPSVVETDEGRHGPALTLRMAKTANATARNGDETMFRKRKTLVSCKMRDS
jgi:hypothetical protein